MSRFVRMMHVTSCLLFSFICCVRQSLANDVPLPLDLLRYHNSANFSLIEMFVWNFCATVVIEYLVIYAFLSWPKTAKLELFFWILFVNLITNPASLVGAVFFGRSMPSDTMAWAVICAVELAATSLEFGLMTWVFGRMHRSGMIDKRLTTKRIMGMVLAANLASFSFGFVGFLFWKLAAVS